MEVNQMELVDEIHEWEADKVKERLEMLERFLTECKKMCENEVTIRLGKRGLNDKKCIVFHLDEEQKSNNYTKPISPKTRVFYDEMIFGTMDERAEKLENYFESSIEILEPKPNRESRRHNEKWQKSRYQRRRNNE